MTNYIEGKGWNESWVPPELHQLKGWVAKSLRKKKRDELKLVMVFWGGKGKTILHLPDSRSKI